MLDRERWAARLAAVARKTLGNEPSLPADGHFRDNRGNHLEIDGPFFATLRGSRAEAMPSARADVRLWAWLSGASPAGDLQHLLTPPSSSTSAPLLPPQRDDEALEVYTDLLLCATHAAWSLAGPAGADRLDADQQANLRLRCTLSGQWLTANLQPDNATNYPWALHVLLECAGTPGYEATHYAETLLHNCQVTHGKADLRSAWILWHAAKELQRS